MICASVACELLVEDRLLRRHQRNQRRVGRACGRSGARRTARCCRVDVDGRVAPLDPVDGVEHRSLDDCADPAGHRRRRVRRLEPGDHRAVPVGDDVRARHSRRGDECSRMRVEGRGPSAALARLARIAAAIASATVVRIVLRILAPFSVALSPYARAAVESRFHCYSFRDEIACDDTERLEPGPLGDQGGLPARRSREREEADLVLGDVDRSFEADARPLPRHRLGGRARPPLTRLTLTCGAACEERLDEVARHTLDGRRARSA